MNPYLIMFVLLFAVLVGAAAYIGKRRKMIDEMHGMMVGMTMGMLAGLITATIFLIPTGNFLYGVIAGSIVGLAFGIPFGKSGGHLGVMEGVVAGPMGGMMGAMLGQMIRPFDIDVFIPFFSFIVLITLLGLSYAVHCGVSCCSGKKKADKVSNGFVTWWAIACIIVLGASVVLSFTLAEAAPSQNAPANDVKLPAYLQQATAEERKETTLQGDYQVVDMVITQSRYSPNVIVAKKGIPLKLNIRADDTAGCAREIVFPAFNIKRIVSNEGITLDLMPNEAGTFKFHCSMDMARGKL